MRSPALVLALLAAPALLACAPPERIRYERELSEAPPGARHAVHGEQLRSLMGDLARLQRERLPQALDMHGEQRRRADEVSRIAASLADSAARIPEALPDSLEAPLRASLEREARTLEARARELAREAPSLPAAALEERVAAIDATCAGCHGRLEVPH